MTDLIQLTETEIELVSGGRFTINYNTGNVSATATNTGTVVATGGPNGGATVAVGAAAVAVLAQGSLRIG
jgi:hypothetical protein